MSDHAERVHFHSHGNAALRRVALRETVPPEEDDGDSLLQPGRGTGWRDAMRRVLETRYVHAFAGN